MWLTRLAIVILALAAGVVGLMNWVDMTKYYSILAAVCSGISGWMAIRLVEEPPRKGKESGPLTMAFRRLISDDKRAALLLLQLAVIFQAVATFKSA